MADYITSADLYERYGSRNVNWIADLDGDGNTSSTLARRTAAIHGATQDINDLLRAAKMLPLLPADGIDGTITWSDTSPVSVTGATGHTFAAGDLVAIYWGADYRRSEVTVLGTTSATEFTIDPLTGFGFALPESGSETAVFSEAIPQILVPANIRDNSGNTPSAISDVALGFAIYWLSSMRGARNTDDKGNPITAYYQEYIQARSKLDAIIKGEIQLDFMYCKICGHRLKEHRLDDKQVCLQDNLCYSDADTSRLVSGVPGSIGLDGVVVDNSYSGMVNGGVL